MKSNKKTIWIIVGILLLISIGMEFARMAKESGLADALASIVLLTLIVLGIIFWIRKSRGGKDRVRRL